MNKYLVGIFLSALMVFTFTSPIFAEGETRVVGVWEKAYWEDNEGIDADPRWKLTISFSRTGEFVWDSTDIQEKYLLNRRTGKRSTGVMKTTQKIEGVYTLNGTKCHIRFNHPLDGKDKETAICNLGYEDNTQEGLLEIRFDKNKSMLRVVVSNRTFYFKKIKSDFNQKDAPGQKSAR